jgi:hypothetical protein
MNLDVNEPQSSSLSIIQDTHPSTANRYRFFLPDVGMTVKSGIFPEYPSSSPAIYDPVIALVTRYVSGGISIGRAAEIIGLCYEDFIQRVIEKGIRLPMGPATLEEFRQEERILQSYLRRSVK